MLSEFEAKNLNALQTLKEKYNVQVVAFPGDILEKLHEYTLEVLDEEANKDETFKRVYAAYKSFVKSNDAWNAISEAAYARALNKL
jgi:TRAP-type mannitol/chloroaromatic compound transport system substrate-binding protein